MIMKVILFQQQMELVRLAIPQKSLYKSRIDYVLDIFNDILEMRNQNKVDSSWMKPPWVRHLAFRKNKYPVIKSGHRKTNAKTFSRQNHIK